MGGHHEELSAGPGLIANPSFHLSGQYRRGGGAQILKHSKPRKNLLRNAQQQLNTEQLGVGGGGAGEGLRY